MENKMKSFRIFILENFVDAKLKWVKAGAPEDEVKKYISSFKELRDKNILSGGQKDISSWVNKPFDEFKSYIDQTLKTYDAKKELKTTVKSGAKRVFSNSMVDVFKINSYEASCKYGANTKWCISGKSPDKYIEYIDNGLAFYFIILKPEALAKYSADQQSRYSKIAVSVYPEIFGTDVVEIYDAEDKLMDNSLDELMSKFNMDNVFAPNQITRDDLLKIALNSVENKQEDSEEGVDLYPYNLSKFLTKDLLDEIVKTEAGIAWLTWATDGNIHDAIKKLYPVPLKELSRDDRLGYGQIQYFNDSSIFYYIYEIGSREYDEEDNSYCMLWRSREEFRTYSEKVNRKRVTVFTQLLDWLDSEG